MEQLNAQQLLETQAEMPEVTIEEISEQILNVLASFVNVGPNGEAPRYDLNKMTPALLFVGAMNGVCDAFSQLHSTEQNRVDYVTAMTALHDMFIRYLIDMNVSASLEMQAQQAPLTEAECSGFPIPLPDAEEPIIEQIFDPNC